MKVIKQKKWSVDWRDFLRGLTLAIITGVLTFITELATAEISWTTVLRVAFTSAGGYILQKLQDKNKVVVVLDKEQNVDQTARRIENNV